MIKLEEMSRRTVSLDAYPGHARQGGYTVLNVAAVADAMEQAGFEHTPARLRARDFGRETIRALGNFVKNLREDDPTRPLAEAVLDHAAHLKDHPEKAPRQTRTR
jgi:hypothetical protein